MARSTYIYFVQDLSDSVIYAGTVKYELVNWLKNNPGNDEGVYRIRDGKSDNAVWLDPDEVGLR